MIEGRDPVEQDKQLKYASLVANTIMLSNVTDLTTVLSSIAADGIAVTPDLVARLSPYTREHIRRFGQYVLDMNDLPAPLNPMPLPFDVPLRLIFTRILNGPVQRRLANSPFMGWPLQVIIRSMRL